MIKNLYQMGTYRRYCIMILRTGQYKLSRERVSLVGVFNGVQGLKLLHVFAGTRVANLVSVFVILRSIIYVNI